MIIKKFVLFVVTAFAEILGCYSPYLCVRQGKPLGLLIPAALSLAAFAWLLTLHPPAAGRTYAAYGGVYVSVAIGWLWFVDEQTPTLRDLVGVAICLVGMVVIATGAPTPKPIDVRGETSTSP
jgi:small multidrug resistance family-3 protein